jgi:hypothetical protein
MDYRTKVREQIPLVLLKLSLSGNFPNQWVPILQQEMLEIIIMLEGDISRQAFFIALMPVEQYESEGFRSTLSQKVASLTS